jgi:hypothetical protein
VLDAQWRRFDQALRAGIFRSAQDDDASEGHALGIRAGESDGWKSCFSVSHMDLKQRSLPVSSSSV